MEACVGQYLTVLISANGTDLGLWSLRTATRSLGWARHMECVVSRAIEDGIEQDEICRLVEKQIEVKLSGGKVVPRIVFENGAKNIYGLRQCQMILLKTMMFSMCITDKMLKWVERAYTEKALLSGEMLSDDKITRDKALVVFKAIEDSDSLRSRISARLLLQNLCAHQAARECWEHKLSEQDGVSDKELTEFAKSMVEGLRPVVTSHNAPEALSFLREPEDRAKVSSWGIDIMVSKHPARLWNKLEFDLLTELSVRNFKFALAYLSHLIVCEKARYKMFGAKPSFTSSTLKHYCSASPWLKKLCIQTLSSSKEDFATRLLEQLKG
mmetsp:Transcript_19634/g.32734  ORF Transcript_19634/g.32734 Transcript_19634/m.32734 type:complete len:326 (-) Transcript_19634:1216-2193(-)